MLVRKSSAMVPIQQSDEEVGEWTYLAFARLVGR